MKIDIIHATAGEGHRKIAISIQEAFARCGRSDMQVRLINFLDFASRTFQSNYAPIYQWSVLNAPNIWGFCYEVLDHPLAYACCRPFRSLTNSLHCKPLLSHILENQPDVVIATHFMPPELLGRAKHQGRLKSKILTVITDFFPHSFWVNPGTDHYWVMADETKEDLVKRGVPNSIVTAGGIPIGATFKPTGRRVEILNKHGLSPDRFTILLTSGSFGIGPQEAILEELKVYGDKVQCFVVCARNTELKSRLDAKTYPFPVKVFGFVDFMPELMETSDLMIAKSGGSTTTESLAKGLCMVVMAPIPGQETRNAKLLKMRDAAFFLKGPEDIRGIMQSVFSDPQVMTRKREAIAALAKPDAADDLVRMVLDQRF